MAQPTQPTLPGMELAAVIPKSAVMVVRDGQPAEVFPDMDKLKAADMEPGTYELWRFGGLFSVVAVPAKVRTVFKSALARGPQGPRKPRKPKPTK